MSKPPPSLYNANTSIEWVHTPMPVPYQFGADYMTTRARDIASEIAGEQIWCLEHPPLYTAGTSARHEDLVDSQKFDVFETGRGGQYTYHGPGQRVAYVMLDLRQRGRDVAAFVRTLEQWVIDTLDEIGVQAERRCGRVGVWVIRDDGREEKIAAIGVRLKKWVSFHGIAVNVAPELSHYAGIVPCGISDHGVTSLKALGHDVSMQAFDTILKRHFERHFGPTVTAEPPTLPQM